MELSELLQRLLELVQSGTYIAQLAAIVLIVSQLAKRAIELAVRAWKSNPEFVIDGTAASMLVLAVQVLFWAGYVISKQAGVETQYNDFVKVVEGVLTALAPILLPAVVTNVVASQGFKQVKKLGVPGFRSAAK